MNEHLIKLLLSVCGVMLAVLLVEWVVTDSVDHPKLPELNNDAKDTGQISLPKMKLAETTAESYMDMVERPLFIEGRRPVVEEEKAADVQEVQTIDDLKLMGIYADHDRYTALFSQLSEKKYLKKMQGEEVGGWIVQEIRPDNVTLERGGKRQTLKLLKPKEQPVAPPRTPKRPPVQSRKINPEKDEDEQ